MKYCILLSFRSLGWYAISAMRKIVLQSNFNKEFTATHRLLPKAPNEENDGNVQVNHISSVIFEGSVPSRKETLPSFYQKLNAQGFLFDALFSATVTNNGIKNLPAKKRTLTKELNDSKVLLHLPKQKVCHQPGQTGQKNKALTANEVYSSVKLNDPSDKEARRLTKPDLQEVLCTLIQKKSVEFWCWATSWISKNSAPFSSSVDMLSVLPIYRVDLYIMLS